MSTPISEEVARLMCPEAFRMRDEFERSMAALISSTGASGDEIDRLREQVLSLARTTELSTAEAAEQLTALHAASDALSAAELRRADARATTDILADIDDTLAEWHGSADSMRWRPEGPDTPASGSLPALSDILSTFSANTEPCTLSLRDLDEAISALLPEGLQFAREPIHVVPEPPVSTLYDRWLQHRICSAYGFTRAQIGLEGPSFLDARYRQRQRNRRKRK